MPQTPKDKAVLAVLCQRFVRLMKDELKMDRSSLAREMGYANPSPIYKVEKGLTFPDVVKLQRLARLKTAEGARPNLDWLITGKGDPVLREEDEHGPHGDQLTELLFRLGPHKLKLLRELLMK